MISLYAGLTSQTIDLFIQNSTTGAGETGLVFNTAGLAICYRKGATGSFTAITLATQTVGGAWSSGGFVELDSTNAPGVYRLDIPNAAVDTAGFVTVFIKGTGIVSAPVRIDCRPLPVDVKQISGDSTAADNLEMACDGGSFNIGGGAVVAASVTGAAGSVTGSVGSVVGSVGGNVTGSVASVVGAVGSVTGNLGGNVNGNVSGSVGSVTGAVGSVTGSVGSVTGSVGGSVASVAGAVGSVAGNVGGDVSGKVIGGGGGTITGDGVRAASVTGAVGSVTGAVGSVTGAVSLDAQNLENIADAVLEDMLSDHTTPGTIGHAIGVARAAGVVQIGLISNAGTATESYAFGGVTVTFAGLDTSGNRSGVTVS